MAEGLSNSGVSSHLHVGVRTVEAYINAVFTALGLHTAPELRPVLF
jgi:DNA-binding NarL/FixJ family response regulator